MTNELDNYWWSARSEVERFWLEITDREDVGADLWAPQMNHGGTEYWSYSLIRAVRPGDIVFHYKKQDSAIIGWSAAVGSLHEKDIVWTAHGTSSRAERRSARDRGTKWNPTLRAGWSVPLSGHTPLAIPVSLAELRKREGELREIRDRIADAFSGPVYFPFELSTKRLLRPTQGYLTKVPSAVVRLFDSLRDAIPNNAGDFKSRSRRTTSLPPTTIGLDELLDLDGERRATTRREQSKIRKLLIGDALTATCCLCGNSFPTELLIAAHIKRRADCTDMEKRDYQNNVMLLCTFGCDELFERGYLIVRNGIVDEGSLMGATHAVKAKVTFLRGKRCSAWRPASELYFTAHRARVASETLS